MRSSLFLWEDSTGEWHWESVKTEQMEGFLRKLMESGVHPASVMVAHEPLFFHWVWKKFHGGISSVSFQKINEEIYGTAPCPASPHAAPDMPAEKRPMGSKLGWLAPDGRFFECDYGGHSRLAREIVGAVKCIVDPEGYLERLGWAKIFRGSGAQKQYCVGMGVDKTLTDSQLRKLQGMGLEQAWGVSDLI